MDIDLAALPDDLDTLHRMISDLVSVRDDERTEAQAEIDRLRNLVRTCNAFSSGAAPSVSTCAPEDLRTAFRVHLTIESW